MLRAVSDIAGHGKRSAWKAFCSNPDLANLGKGDFHDETYSSYPRRGNVRVVMFGKCILPKALPHTMLCATVAHSTSSLLVDGADTGNVSHSISSTTRDNGMVKGQRETCSHPDAINSNVHKLSYADAPNGASPGNVVAKTQTCTAQNLASI